MMKKILCPCHSGKMYDACCQSFHNGEPPATALQLMRSRYAAYALNLPDYIVDTTHPSNAHYEKDRERWKQQILLFSKSTLFQGLEILSTEEKGDFATVVFTAHLSQNLRDATFTEKSTFEKIKDRWFYLKGEVR